MENSVALILEGGGSRGAYTAGVLDVLMENNIEFESCYAVSAGAVAAQSLMSRQIGRAFRINKTFMNDWRYCSMRSFLLTGDFVGAKFSYDKIPNELDPLDYKAFRENPMKLYTVAANLETGEVEYLRVKDLETDVDKIRASASLPILSRTVKIDGKKYLDGGIVDSIPVQYSLEAGHKKAVVILTQHKGFVKERSGEVDHIRRMYGLKYPEFAKAAETRHVRYNEALEFIDEHEGKDVFVIRPKHPVDVGRMELNEEKLDALYQEALSDTREILDDLKAFMEK